MTEPELRIAEHHHSVRFYAVESVAASKETVIRSVHGRYAITPKSRHAHASWLPPITADGCPRPGAFGFSRHHRTGLQFWHGQRRTLAPLPGPNSSWLSGGKRTRHEQTLDDDFQRGKDLLSLRRKTDGLEDQNHGYLRSLQHRSVFRPVHRTIRLQPPQARIINASCAPPAGRWRAHCWTPTF